MSKIGIVTVVTNEKNNLKDFFEALASQSFKDFTLYFIDNNSADGSQEYFRDLNNKNLFPVSYITLDHNSGFSAGSNTGARKAIKDGCEYLLILNNDVVLDSHCLDELKNCIESETNIAASGMLLFRHQKQYPGIIQEFGGKIDFKKARLEKYYENTSFNDITLPEKRDTDFIGGGVLFINAKIFESVGMFEEMYFGYFDEIDLSYRLIGLNNYKLLVTSKTMGYHNHNWTKRNKKSYYFEYYLSERNKYLYFHKYAMRFSMLKNLIADLIKFPWRLIWFIKVCDFTLGVFYLRGMLNGLLNKSGKPGFVK